MHIYIYIWRGVSWPAWYCFGRSRPNLQYTSLRKRFETYCCCVCVFLSSWNRGCNSKKTQCLFSFYNECFTTAR